MDPAAVSMEEMKEACDILDVTHTNGGGTLDYKEADNGRVEKIRFSESAPATAMPSSLGEIGSPVPGHSVLAGGFGGRFPGLGPQGFWFGSVRGRQSGKRERVRGEGGF
jgi:hypothetical protein